MGYKPGQYLTFWLEIPGHPPVKRNYSISAAPNGETYRISVISVIFFVRSPI